MKKLSLLTAHKFTVILILALIGLVFVGGVFAQKMFSKPPIIVEEEVDMPFDPEGPFALLVPRRDGNALILNIKRVSSYDNISYELAYQSDGIDRGVQGTLNTKDRSSEYTQEILFGTCSKGDTFSTLHCVFDKNVENGTLTLRIKGTPEKTANKTKLLQKVYKMTTTWHLQKPDVALGKLNSGDGHFAYSLGRNITRQELGVVGFSIINDLSAVPKIPDGNTILGKVYALNVPTAKRLKEGDVLIELAEKPTDGAKIAQFIESENKWNILETNIDGSKLTAKASREGIFTVLVEGK